MFRRQVSPASIHKRNSAAWIPMACLRHGICHSPKTPACRPLFCRFLFRRPLFGRFLFRRPLFGRFFRRPSFSRFSLRGPERTTERLSGAGAPRTIWPRTCSFSDPAFYDKTCAMGCVRSVAEPLKRNSGRESQQTFWSASWWAFSWASWSAAALGPPLGRLLGPASAQISMPT